MGHMKDLDRRIRQGGDDAIAAVHEVFQMVPMWISVEERLPDEGNDVLLCDGEWVTMGHVSGDYWYVIEAAEACGHWEFSRLPFWMPLPEPPEVK